jgi:hypothetical protein
MKALDEIDEVGDAIKAGKLDALYERFREAGVSHPDEYEPVTIEWEDAWWLTEVLIEVQHHRYKDTPVMENGDRDRLLLKMAMVLACMRGPGNATYDTRALAKQILESNKGKYP